MIPIVAIVGRTNVGKSTLFNKLTQTKDSLTANFNGTTRDRIYGSISINKKEIVVIDTGGLKCQSNKSDKIDQDIIEQTIRAINESNMIIFVVNAREGVLPEDYYIANKIRTFQKKIILVINKIDGLNQYTSSLDFHNLGFQHIHCISALNNIGITTLINQYLSSRLNLVDTLITENSHIKQYAFIKSYKNHIVKNQDLFLRLTVIGKPNVGKSTLINSLLKEQRVLTNAIAGTTRDSIIIPVIKNYNKYILIDTAGISKKKNKNNYIHNISKIKTLSAINISNVVLFVIDVQDMITNQDLSLLNSIIKSGKSIIILINKWDLISIKKRKIIKSEICCKLQFLKNFTIYFISGLYSINIKQIFLLARKSYNSSILKISSFKLTNIMQTAVQKHEPPMINGKKIKFKYAHPGGCNPPVIIIHGNRLDKLLSSYKCYLQNYFQNELRLINTPIKLYFKENKNPYVKY
ncbi:GTPase Der [Buchnera aphidicola (Eriosoma lanigerum)]|uniref:ribosome biogenesis GTPase Der n=1 Tax=Buchnera aphidicola TaxID=9 RepID=UPI0034647074